MARGVPVNPETRAKILELHAQGMTRNDIAREVGVSTGVVSRVVEAAGGTFERASSTAAATAARAADFADMRAELAREMVAVAKQELRRAQEPYVVFSFGGADNTYSEHELELPPSAEVRQMQTTAALAFDKVSKVVESQADPGEAGAKAMLRQLGEALGVA